MINHHYMNFQIDEFLREDVGFGDLTAQSMIDEDATMVFDMNAREDMIISGSEVAAMVFKRYVPDCEIDIRMKDGSKATKGDIILRVSGNARGLLSAERTALNLIQRMSGIATVTAQYVKEIEGTGATLIDSRKTTPGLRMIEKHAVVCGGGRNHRLALDGGIMIKDNHIAVCGGLTEAIKRAKAMVPVLVKVEVECDHLDQVKEATEAGADILLLDNMSPDMLREAVAIVGGRIPLEASGGIRLETIRAVAETGVNFISVGRITQSSPCVDIGLDEPQD